MNNEELLEEARAYFAQLQKPAEEPEVTYISDYTLYNKSDKENLNKNGNRVLLIDQANGKKSAFLLIPDLERNRFKLARIKETSTVQLLTKKTNNSVSSFDSHKQFFPNLTLELQGETTGAVVRMKDGTYATITDKLEVIK